jgi:hypothetical protein
MDLVKRHYLRHNASLDFAVGLVTFGRNGINLVNENDRRGVLGRLLKGTPQVALGLA